MYDIRGSFAYDTYGINNILGITDKFNPFTNVLVGLISSIFHADLGYTGYLMSGSHIAVKLYKGEVTEIDKRYAPFSIQRTKDFKSFLTSRCIDTNRANAQALFHSLQMKEIITRSLM